MAKRLGFTYIFCNDLERMKWFYTKILHLNLIWDSKTSIAFKIGEHQLSIEFNENFNILSSKFSNQPGWEGGTEPRTGWSLECDKEDFIEIVNSAIMNEIPAYYNEPNWKGYWSFPILDPMNNTIEITCTAEDIPNNI
ncbi:VOC family protein [Evansella tamaricis]|uniref:VOC family protein n=1 Tax=Evansella tamaricis TaxID=2069301 RepID=A0ABS6JJ06_9BACI|nr:VOC family protein [Evansella tamaricis]MBU9712313.1 VOC family protein [Evansella tamaricis]